MGAKREQALVGLFVIVAAGILLITVFSLTGAFHQEGPTYRTYFKFAGGLQAGAAVRYAGGPPLGRVERVRVDPQDPTRMEVAFRVEPDTPVKTDSKAKIDSLSALGDNFLDIIPGTAAAPRALSGSILKSSEYVGFSDIEGELNNLGPVATQLLQNLNARVNELQVTIARVNDLLNAENRANLAASLSNVRGMLEEDRPRIHSTLGHLDTASAKLGPLLDGFKETAAQADKTLAHVDATLIENRPDLRQSIVELRQTLASASALTDQLDRTLEYNSENIDELLENLRHVSENLKDFTDMIKKRPYTLIRTANPPAREPGGGPQ